MAACLRWRDLVGALTRAPTDFLMRRRFRLSSSTGHVLEDPQLRRPRSIEDHLDEVLHSLVWPPASLGLFSFYFILSSLDTCGGNALKFYAAVRLKLRKTELLKDENEVIGIGISVQVVKNKLAPAMTKAKLGLRFGRGFCSESEVLELACEHGIIVKEGDGYLIEGEFFGNHHAAELYLAENEVVFDKMVSILRRLLFETEESIVDS